MNTTYVTKGVRIPFGDFECFVDMEAGAWGQYFIVVSSFGTVLENQTSTISRGFDEVEDGRSEEAPVSSTHPTVLTNTN